MESLTFPRIIVLVLLLSGVCMVMVPSADAQKRCTEVLDPQGCNLTNCRKACIQKHPAQQPNGECASSGGITPIYKCVCVFDC